MPKSKNKSKGKRRQNWSNVSAPEPISNETGTASSSQTTSSTHSKDSSLTIFSGISSIERKGKAGRRARAAVLAAAVETVRDAAAPAAETIVKSFFPEDGDQTEGQEEAYQSDSTRSTVSISSSNLTTDAYSRHGSPSVMRVGKHQSKKRKRDVHPNKVILTLSGMMFVPTLGSIIAAFWMSASNWSGWILFFALIFQLTAVAIEAVLAARLRSRPRLCWLAESAALVLLIMSIAAFLAGILLVSLECRGYDFTLPGGPPTPLSIKRKLARKGIPFCIVMD